MAGRENVSGPVAGQCVNAAPHFSADFIGRAKRQNPLVLNAAVKTDALTKISLQANQIHAGAGPLEGIQNVNAHLDKVRQKRTHSAVIVVKYLDAELPAQVNKASMMRFIEFAIDIQAK